MTSGVQPKPIQLRQTSSDTTEFEPCAIQKAKMLHVGSVWCVKTHETKDGDEGMQQAVFSLLTFLPHLHRPSDYPLMQGWFPQPTKIKRNIIIKINKTWEIYSRKNLYKNLLL